LPSRIAERSIGFEASVWITPDAISPDSVSTDSSTAHATTRKFTT
jgi:hypothetical protein